MGGSLFIFFSRGYFWIKCHLLIKMFLWFGKAEWYVITKGRIFFRTPFFFCIADFRSINLTSEDFFVMVTSITKAFFEVVDVHIERFSWGISSQKCKGFARGCQEFLGCEMSCLLNSCIQKVNLFIRYFSRKFNCRVMPVWKSNEFSNFLPLS